MPICNIFLFTNFIHSSLKLSKSLNILEFHYTSSRYLTVALFVLYHSFVKYFAPRLAAFSFVDLHILLLNPYGVVAYGNCWLR